MPLFEVSLRQWVLFETVAYVEAESPSEARKRVDRTGEFGWAKTGAAKPATISGVRRASDPA